MEKINYFDENLFLYYEENTIFYRLKKFNYKVYIDRDVTIMHNHSITINKNINYKDKLKILKKSQEYYYSKVLKTNKFMLFLLKLSNKIVLLLKVGKSFDKCRLLIYNYVQVMRIDIKSQRVIRKI